MNDIEIKDLISRIPPWHEIPNSEQEITALLEQIECESNDKSTFKKSKKSKNKLLKEENSTKYNQNLINEWEEIPLEKKKANGKKIKKKPNNRSKKEQLMSSYENVSIATDRLLKNGNLDDVEKEFVMRMFLKSVKVDRTRKNTMSEKQAEWLVRIIEKNK